MEKNINQEIEKLEDKLWQAEKSLDVDALDRIYADDIMVTAPIGIVVDKPAVMTEVRNAAAHATIGTYGKDNLKLRVYGDTVVTSYRMAIEGQYEQTTIKRQLQITNVWLKRKGGWQVVYRHTASLEQDKAQSTRS